MNDKTIGDMYLECWPVLSKWKDFDEFFDRISVHWLCWRVFVEDNINYFASNTDYVTNKLILHYCMHEWVTSKNSQIGYIGEQIFLYWKHAKFLSILILRFPYSVYGKVISSWTLKHWVNNVTKSSEYISLCKTGTHQESLYIKFSGQLTKWMTGVLHRSNTGATDLLASCSGDVS